MKNHAPVDAFGDRRSLDHLEAGAGEPLGRREAAREDQFITRRRHPIDVLEHLIDADPRALLQIFQAHCNPAAASQLREWRIFVFAGALDIQDRVTGGTTPLARQFGTELARRAEFDVIGKQLLVFRVWATFDDDVVRLQLEAGHVHETVLDAASERGSEPNGGKYEHPADQRRADAQVKLLHKLIFRDTLQVYESDRTGDTPGRGLLQALPALYQDPPCRPYPDGIPLSDWGRWAYLWDDRLKRPATTSFKFIIGWLGTSGMGGLVSRQSAVR
jgi:hypothetical protein